MNVGFADQSYPFRPWQPSLGRVFAAGYAFDSETALIDQERPWLTPPLVIGAAFGGDAGYFISREQIDAFFDAHREVPVAMHNAPFDLAVIHLLAPALDIYGWVDRNLVWDTQILHRLLTLASEGHTAGHGGESTLERCVQLYLNCQLPKDVLDSHGKPVRLSYGQWLNRPPGEIEPIYLEYLAKDVITTFAVFRELRAKIAAILANSSDVWGYVSPSWLREQADKWGCLTHHIQLRGAIVLHAITANGLHLDVSRREELADHLSAMIESQRQALAKHGYLPGQKGSAKALQSIFKRLQREHRGLSFPTTDTGQISTAHDAIAELADVVPFVKALTEYRETEKLLGSFLGKMNRGVLHPSFNVLARTGRTTSFGEINAQNLPTDDRVRSCFIPSPGHAFIDADYKTIELATLAQACMGQFGLESQMAIAINAGKDLHTLVAAAVTGSEECDVSKEERRKAKAINFGKPGGMSLQTLKLYAKANYGVDLSDEAVEGLSSAWLDLFPEMRKFLGDGSDLGLGVATLLGLTPESHYEHTGDRRFVNHPANAGRTSAPHAILGGMCLKVLKVPDPTTGDGLPYSQADIDYFWSRLQARIDMLPPKLQGAARDRQPSVPLQKAVMSLVGKAGVFTLTGRLRANASYCARHNTVFQGLAADGAKLAMWRLWRSGYRLVNFIHDQVLVEVPANADLMAKAQDIRRLMIEGMNAVVPDVNMDVSFAATDRWYKNAEAAYDSSGEHLLIWRPDAPEAPNHTLAISAAA